LIEVRRVAPFSEGYAFTAGDDAVGQASSTLSGVLVETRFVVI
jgi:hypothetical protein